MPRMPAKKTSLPSDGAAPACERILAEAERVFGERGSLASALPGRSEAEVWRAYQFKPGAMVHPMRDAGRLERLSGGLAGSTTRPARRVT